MNRQDETDYGDNAYAVAIEVSSTGHGGIYRATYRKPRAKMIVSSTFLRVAICSPQTIGIGRRTMIRSIATLQLLSATADLMGLSHTPGWRGSQYLTSGRQVRKSLMTVPAPKPSTRTTTAYATMRNALFERKIVT